MLAKRMRLGLWTATLLTGFVGVVNLLSAVTPGVPARVHWIRAIFPFEVRAGAHIFAALSGFLLLTLAANLLRRKRVAWLLTSALLVVSIISNLVKGFDYEEVAISGVLLAQLLWMRTVFTAESDRPSIAQGFRVLVGALLFTLAYGTIGFYLLDEHYSVNFSLSEAVMQTLTLFFTADDTLQPQTRFGEFFPDSVIAIGVLTMGFALVMLLRPVLLRAGARPEERQRAREIVQQYGRSSLAAFTLLDDKSYYFSPSGRSVIGYVAKGRGALALGDPIGPDEDVEEAIRGFQQFCARNDWYPAFYQTQPTHLNRYYGLGFRSLKIGAEAIIDLKAFTLEGKAGRKLRPAINKMQKQGFHVEFLQPPISSQVLKHLREVSDEWLKMMNGSEKKFSLGWFDESHLRQCEIVAVYTPSGDISAFANIMPEYQLNEITNDLMRRRVEVEPGTMDFMFISMFQHYKQQGYDSFNLGLSALAGMDEGAPSDKIEQAMRYLYQHLRQFYNFEGLHSYKEKFHPRWEPRYLVYPGLASLPDVVIGLIRADSGDRLLDYFKPGS